MTETKFTLNRLSCKVLQACGACLLTGRRKRVDSWKKPRGWEGGRKRRRRRNGGLKGAGELSVSEEEEGKELSEDACCGCWSLVFREKCVRERGPTLGVASWIRPTTEAASGTE